MRRCAAPSLAVALVALGVVSFVARNELKSPNLADVPAVGASLKLYAYQLFTTYLLPVQVLGFLLLTDQVRGGAARSA